MSRVSHNASASDHKHDPKATAWLSLRLGCAAKLLPQATLLLSLLPASVQGQFTFATNNGSITIIGYTGSSGTVVIPDTTNGYPVTSIGDGVFQRRGGLTSLTNVTIPDSITSIGSSAFNSCINLASLTIPNSVTNIGAYAFGNCASLPEISVGELNAFYASVNGVLFDEEQTMLIQCPALKAGSYSIPNSATNIASRAFSGCASLTSITIPNSVTSIGSAAFSGCSYLSSVAIPDSVTTIGSGMFHGCSSLTGITIPSSVTSIEDRAFWGTGLTSISIPDSVTRIGYLAFCDCTGLTNVMIGNGVTDIGGYSFFRCHNLADISMGNSVTAIGDTAFWQCYGLTRIVFPKTLTSIAGQAFVSCVNLTGFYFQGNAPNTDPSNSAFFYDYNLIMYYLPNSTGWGTTFGGRPTALWRPQLHADDGSFGVRTNQFGFNISWASGMTVVVEAVTNPGDAIWSPLQTNLLTGSSCFFSDPEWQEHPARFYRLRSP